MSIIKIIPIILVFAFLALMLITKENKDRLYIKFIVLTFPFLNIPLFPLLKGFSLITFIYFFFFYKNKKTIFYASRFYLVIFFVLISLIITGLYFSELGPSFVGFRDLVAIFPIFIFAKILIYELIEDENYFFELLHLLKILLIISLIFLGVQLIIGVKFSLSKQLNPNIILSNGIRYPSFFGDPQDFSMFLAILSFMCLIKKDINSKIPVFNYILIILSVLAILSSGGRAGLIGFIFGITLIIIFGKSISAKIWVIVIGILIYFVVMEFQNKFAIFNRGTDLDDAYKFRHEIWGQAFDMFLNKPIFGIGIGNYERHVVLHNPDQVWPTGDDFIPFDCPENGYLKFLSELGGPAFIIIFIILLLPVFRGMYMFLLKKDFILIYLLSGFMVWMIGFNSNYSFGDIRIEILIGLLISMLISRQHFLSSKNAVTKV